MRLVTFFTPAGLRAGRVDGEDVVELDAPDVGALLASGADWRQRAAGGDGGRRPLAQVRLAPVVPAPSKIICVGMNYQSHIDETRRDRPTHPSYFAKFARALIGPYDPITLPAVSKKVDWEAELGVLIGSPARHVAEADAERHIAGMTVVNDVSVRDWQRRTSQFLAGKTFEGSTPVGPALVTLDEVPDGGKDLAVTCEIDGQLMQSGRTSELLFGVAELIADLTTILTLDPGDLIVTGTPAGVGAVRKPPVFLQPGQVVRTAIEGVGELVNTCVAEQIP